MKDSAPMSFEQALHDYESAFNSATSIAREGTFDTGAHLEISDQRDPLSWLKEARSAEAVSLKSTEHIMQPLVNPITSGLALKSIGLPLLLLTLSTVAIVGMNQFTSKNSTVEVRVNEVTSAQTPMNFEYKPSSMNSDSEIFDEVSLVDLNIESQVKQLQFKTNPRADTRKQLETMQTRQANSLKTKRKANSSSVITREIKATQRKTNTIDRSVPGGASAKSTHHHEKGTLTESVEKQTLNDSESAPANVSQRFDTKQSAQTTVMPNILAHEIAAYRNARSLYQNALYHQAELAFDSYLDSYRWGRLVKDAHFHRVAAICSQNQRARCARASRMYLRKIDDSNRQIQLWLKKSEK